MTDNTEAFEKWYWNYFGGSSKEFTFSRFKNGEYKQDLVMGAFYGYQAATAQSQQRIAELEAEVKRLHTGDNLKALLNEDTDILMQNCLEMSKTIRAKDELIAELEKDAERLDFLEKETNGLNGDCKSFRESIDKAIAESKRD